MSLLTSQNLSRSFGPVDIFEGISISIPHNARIAIVGSNGVGKTTCCPFCQLNSVSVFGQQAPVCFQT